MNGLRVAKLAGAAACALVVSGFVVAITASAAGVQMPQFAASPPAAKPTTPQAQQYCQSYLNHLAKDLNTSTTKVQDAAKLAFNQTVDDAVNSKQITKAQGDALKAKYATNQLCSGELSAIGRGVGAAAGRALGQEAFSAEASVLGTTPSDLMTQVKAGKAVKDLAAAKGMDETAFRNAYVAKIKSDLAALVSNGTITQPQADKVIQAAQNGPIPFWNGLPKHASKPRTATG
jgi:hypothetical protein